MKRYSLPTAALIPAALLPSALLAQTAPPDQISASVLEEIIVTANRREETLQKSSLSVQVLSDDQIRQAGVTHSQDLNRLIPGIQIAGGGNAAQMRPFVWPLVSAGYRVIAYDQPAHGVSGGKLTGLPDFADVFAELAWHYGRVKAVIGHSLGAAAAKTR